MKKLFSIVLLMACTITLMAQSSNNEDEVVKIEKWNQHAYREGEVIVKFKADGAVQMRKNAKGKFQTASISQVDALFAKLGVEEVEELMPQVGARKAPRRMRAYNGAEVKDHDLSKLYLIRFSEQVAAPMSNAGEMRTVHQVVEQLQALEEVEFAEPNYLVFALAMESADSATYVAEPLYSEQWGPAAINLPALWNMPKTSTKRPVIAILDTGVDVEHPDLKDNIWVNEKEKNGVAGKDDDGNGIVDDIYGYDFVNQTGNMADFNGHGTHCAGIAAAVGNNGIGITGANPDALIMPITVMQSDGTGDVATIIKGIDYAAANGADVISMSLGGYSYSMAEEQALGKAYATAVIVAAAGNDGQPIEKLLVYPGCLQFILGVQATTPGGGLAGFSNRDSDPIYTTYSTETDLYNYELRAPGTGIMSTYPQGRYKKLQGTSMATPMAAGAISRLLQCKEYNSWELLFGDLIYTANTDTVIDIYAAYKITDADRKPNLRQVTYYLTDTLGDNDSRADAGDTIALYPVLRNDWGQAENIRMWMEVGYYDGTGDFVPDDTTLITFLTDTVDFGRPLSSYAKNRSVNPIRFVVNKKCVDGRHINLCLRAKCDNMMQSLTQNNVIKVENGVEIGGILEDDLTLYPDVHYIVTRELLIPSGITLIIKPGTIIRFKDNTGLTCEGTIIANGTPDSLIVFTKAELDQGKLASYKITFGNYSKIAYAMICDFEYVQPSYGGTLSNCIIKDVRWESYSYSNMNQCVITNCQQVHVGGSTQFNINQTNIVTNTTFLSGDPISLRYRLKNCNAFSNLVGGIPISATYYINSISVLKPSYPSYLGSAREDILHSYIADFNNPLLESGAGYGKGVVHLDYVAKEPIREAHGIVWKVVVNGYDAQDEFEMLPPLGVGKHKFEVYFNRAMDTSIVPHISMGVRLPYTQNIIAEDGSWSADSTIYTAYLTINGKTNTDGLNRIYVYGAEDTDHFEIPEEYHRFNVQVAATGSLSTGLMAEAGLGKVALTWQTDEEDFEDLLGYNIYRWTEDTIKWDRHYDSSCKCYIEAGWKFDTVQISQSLIDSQDTAFVDFDVVPGKTYYYVIKQVTTSLSSYSISNPVAATPLTAQKGDANGSMSVDVADVVTEVAYLTGNNPQPFIFEAADVNSDNTVNILDIVGTVNIITNPAASSLGFSDNNTATYSIEDGILYVETPVVLGGVQFSFDAEAEISALEALNGFEQVTWNTADHLNFMAYSMSGKTLGVGKHALLYVGDAEIKKIILSNTQGQNIPAIQRTTTDLSSVEAMQMRLPNPNPFTTQVNIPYVVGQSGKHEVRLVFTNVAGLMVDSYSATQTFGEYTYTWRPGALLEGMYFVTLYVDGKKMQSSKLVKVN
ncbi:MAG: S8 family serine peptidase [Paludibacteraceae bacterium]|nr:S8 family serine peptidase [Paludibacteraceae bacterium]